MTTIASAVKPDITTVLNELLADELRERPAAAGESRMDRVNSAMFDVLRRASLFPGSHPSRRIVCDALRKSPLTVMSAADTVAYEMRLTTLRNATNQ